MKTHNADLYIYIVNSVHYVIHGSFKYVLRGYLKSSKNVSIGNISCLELLQNREKTLDLRK